jgi:peptidoglycan/xylan/chitin deacetylase (PgdA/CDA1 family)
MLGALAIAASLATCGGTSAPVAAASGFARPLVSIEFDDGWESAYQNGLPAVEAFGWKATQNIITDTAIHNAKYGAGTYMTAAQIVDWKARGDIGSHTVTHPHLPKLPPAKIKVELENSAFYLDLLLHTHVRLFVTPYCETNETVTSMARPIYESQRNCDSPVNDRDNFDPYNLRSLSVEKSTTDKSFTDVLRQTKQTNGWTILVWHQVESSNDPYSVTPQRLTHELELVKRSGIHVELTQAALDEELGHTHR